MASFPVTSFCKFCFFSSLLLISLSFYTVSAYEFRISGPRGWIKPTGNETETYNQWAARNRFHIGDSIYFKYKNDSVLVVDASGYLKCNISSPIFEYKDGNTVYKFDRYGFFYFISGQPGHCKSGQKLIIRVMGQDESESPGSAPAPGSSGGQDGQGGSGSFSPSGLPIPNSNIKVAVAPPAVLLGGMTVIFWFLF